MMYMRAYDILHPEATPLNLWEVLVKPVRAFEEQRYQRLMQEYH